MSEHALADPVPGRHAGKNVLDAGSAEAVRLASNRAEIAPQRIVEAVEHPGPRLARSEGLRTVSIAFVQLPADAQRTADYEIRRSARARGSRLTITEDGRAVVVLPLRGRESEAADLVARHRAWINRHIARIRARQTALDLRPALEAGREIAIAGTPHRVVVTTALHGRRSEVRQEPGHLVVQRAAGDRRTTADLLEAWMRARARDAIAETLGRRAVEMGLEVDRLTIRDQRTRWGSASRRRTLSFNWRLVMCPPQIVDYVVVHELAHLRHAGHGPRFWALVKRHFSDPAGARRWLRDNHDALRHALD